MHNKSINWTLFSLQNIDFNFIIGLHKSVSLSGCQLSQSFGGQITFKKLKRKGLNVKLRAQLVNIALKWQAQFGVAPAITSALSEYDAAMILGMPENEYSLYMQDKTAVAKGHDLVFNDIKYQIKAHRPSGKPGSNITNAGKAKNYEWDILIWIRYDVKYEIEEAWLWEREKYIENFDIKSRISPDDMRKGKQLI